MQSYKNVTVEIFLELQVCDRHKEKEFLVDALISQVSTVYCVNRT